MLELCAKILNAYISPKKEGKRKDGTAWSVEEGHKVQLIWEVPQLGGDVKMVTQDLTLSKEAYALCVGKQGRDIRIPVETYVIEGKLGMKAAEGAVPQFVPRSEASPKSPVPAS